MVGYCVCGIFRKSRYSVSRSKLLTSATPVSVHGGGYHIWEVTSPEVTQFLKVRLGSSYPVIVADESRTGRICRDNLLCPDDLGDQAESPLPDRTRLCAF